MTYAQAPMAYETMAAPQVVYEQPMVYEQPAMAYAQQPAMVYEQPQTNYFPGSASFVYNQQPNNLQTAQSMIAYAPGASTGMDGPFKFYASGQAGPTSVQPMAATGAPAAGGIRAPPPAAPPRKKKQAKKTKKGCCA